MKKTRISELLGIEYPLIQGGMNWISNAELAAAVSNAGGLGVVSPTAAMDVSDSLTENLRKQIRKTSELTDRPFGVNLPLMNPMSKDLVDLVIEERVAVVTTSAGNPATFTAQLKAAGIKVLHVVASVKHAKGAEKHGVDAVIAEGYEAGGHNGFDELPTFVLVPQVVDEVSVPVIAAGGIMDARGIVAAMALGAEGVQMGTLFITTRECVAHLRFKQAVVEAKDTGTVITGRKVGPTRGIKNPVADKVMEMEGAGASVNDILTYVGFARSRQGQLEGDWEEGEMYCGAGAGLVKGVIDAKEVMEQLVSGVPGVINELA
ncbi:MAG: nitronate monooxygenase [Chloroflexota bacterium]|nr:nitronate monooxygenase [Chloroflexota bacterium]